MRKKSKKRKGINTAPIRCPYCGSKVIYRSADGIYQDNSRGIMLYVCSNYPECDAYVRTHTGTRMPVGTMANHELRMLKMCIRDSNSDEDGNAEVGDYLIILTDKNGKPIFNSEITIDINDNVTIKLPSGRLLDYSDQTTITAIYTDTQSAKSDLQIFIYDTNNNAAKMCIRDSNISIRFTGAIAKQLCKLA